MFNNYGFSWKITLSPGLKGSEPLFITTVNEEEQRLLEFSGFINEGKDLMQKASTDKNRARGYADKDSEVKQCYNDVVDEINNLALSVINECKSSASDIWGVAQLVQVNTVDKGLLQLTSYDANIERKINEAYIEIRDEMVKYQNGNNLSIGDGKFSEFIDTYKQKFTNWYSKCSNICELCDINGEKCRSIHDKLVKLVGVMYGRIMYAMGKAQSTKSNDWNNEINTLNDRYIGYINDITTKWNKLNEVINVILNVFAINVPDNLEFQLKGPNDKQDYKYSDYETFAADVKKSMEGDTETKWRNSRDDIARRYSAFVSSCNTEYKNKNVATKVNDVINGIKGEVDLWKELAEHEKLTMNDNELFTLISNTFAGIIEPDNEIIASASDVDTKYNAILKIFNKLNLGYGLIKNMQLGLNNMRACVSLLRETRGVLNDVYIEGGFKTSNIELVFRFRPSDKEEKYWIDLALFSCCHLDSPKSLIDILTMVADKDTGFNVDDVRTNDEFRLPEARAYKGTSVIESKLWVRNALRNKLTGKEPGHPDYIADFLQGGSDGDLIPKQMMIDEIAKNNAATLIILFDDVMNNKQKAQITYDKVKVISITSLLMKIVMWIVAVALIVLIVYVIVKLYQSEKQNLKSAVSNIKPLKQIVKSSRYI